MNTYFRKKDLREKMRKKRALITPEERGVMSAEITKKILSLAEYKSAKMIFCYVPLKNEVDTFSLIKTALGEQKSVAVPRCIPGHPLMDFYYINSLDDLKEGSYGILEPQENEKYICNETDGFCILPGLSFDRMGNRLGYGKGYYDRFLHSFSGVTAGVCFSNTLTLTSIPRGRFDVPADIVITDKEIIKTR